MSVNQDFSHLALWQADLREVNLHQVNLAHADLSKTVFTEPLSIALSIAFSPDGQLLAIGDINCEVRVWRVADGKNLITCQGHTNWIWSVAFSPNGQTLAGLRNQSRIKLKEGKNDISGSEVTSELTTSAYPRILSSNECGGVV